MTESYKSSTKGTNDSLSSLDTTTSSSNILVTLRRMKIEENALTKEINKASNFHEGEECYGSNYLEFKKYCGNIKSSLVEIKNLYEEIKSNTTSEDNFELLDIDDVKRDVLGLEKKIKTMKAHLQSELTTLKAQEQDLAQEVYENSNRAKLMRKLRSPKPKFNEFVPSPVGVLINSPFKCPEVQQFQNFMKCSRNRYGGWNAYHHNIFEQIWRKYFDIEAVDEDNNLEYFEEKQKNSDEYYTFIQELLHKITGLHMDDVNGHHKWYLKYTYLKNKQQKALNRWRENKKLIKKHRSDAHLAAEVSNHLIDKTDQDVIKTVVSDEIKEIEKTFSFYDKNSESSSHVDISDESKEKHTNNWRTAKAHRYLQHTAQWKSRCNSSNDTSKRTFNIEDVERLGVPVWRSCLT